jgi:hypothetical protein
MDIISQHIYSILQSSKLYFIHKSTFSYYNMNFTNIDFIVFTPNLIICISTNCFLYDSYNLQNFIKEKNIIQNYYHLTNNKYSIGINFTMFKLSNQDEKLLNNNNIKNIHHLDINKSMNKFMQILYSYNLYCYDYSSDCIMID